MQKYARISTWATRRRKMDKSTAQEERGVRELRLQPGKSPYQYQKETRAQLKNRLHHQEKMTKLDQAAEETYRQEQHLIQTPQKQQKKKQQHRLQQKDAGKQKNQDK